MFSCSNPAFGLLYEINQSINQSIKNGQTTHLVYANHPCCLHWTRCYTSHHHRGLFHLSIGKIFNFSMKHEKAKNALSTKLRSLLDVTNSLQIYVQTKLKISTEYITSQISFELKTYNSFSKTWIAKELDSTANGYIKDWLKLPICACVEKFKSLPKHSCGLSIQSFTFIHDKLWLSKRYNLKHNQSADIQQIWQATRHKYIEIDNLMENKTLPQSLHQHKFSELRASKLHIDSGMVEYHLVASGKHFSIHTHIPTPTTPYCFESPLIGNVLIIRCALYATKMFIKQTNTFYPSDHLFLRWVDIRNDTGALDKQTKHAKYKSLLWPWRHWEQSYSRSVSTKRSSRPCNNTKPLCSCPGATVTVCHKKNLEKTCKFKTEKYKNLNHFLLPKFESFQYIFSLSKFQYTVSWQTTSRLFLPELNYKERPHWYSHWGSQWEKILIDNLNENPNETLTKILIFDEVLDEVLDSWWGSWFLMRFLIRLLILNEVLAHDLMRS